MFWLNMYNMNKHHQKKKKKKETKNEFQNILELSFLFTFLIYPGLW